MCATAHQRSKRTRTKATTFLEIVRLSEELQRDFVELFKPYELSVALYNVLRVLRGAPGGLTCGEVAGRLVQHDPDITRLLDRLEKRALIERRRSTTDRRVVRTTITEAGLALLAGLDGPVDEVHHRQFGEVSETRLQGMLDVMNEIRAARRTGT